MQTTIIKTLDSIHQLSLALWTIADTKAKQNGQKVVEKANLEGHDEETKVYTDTNNNMEPAYISQKSTKRRGRHPLKIEDTQVLCI